MKSCTFVTFLGWNCLLLSVVQATIYDPQECKKSREGCEYMGSVSVTSSGIECQRWDSQSPHDHSFTHPHMYPDRDWNALANKCRNPDSEADGPWCYTVDPDVRFDFCNVTTCDVFADCGASCKPSASCRTTASGAEYVGKRGVTASGRPCQRWDRQFPHSHAIDASQLPDATLSDAENFCRNPDGEPSPWCYTTDNETRFELCDIPVCSDCKQHADGSGFAGTVALTVSQRVCQRWDSQDPHAHPFTDSDYFPDASLDITSNYCRNPNGRDGGVWCYTQDPDVEWEYCDVPNCPTDNVLDDKSRRTVKHVLQIGVDGLHHECWLQAPGGAPNLQRMAQEGAYTYYKSRTDMFTFSAPGWSSQVCGMDIELTGCTANGWQAPWMGYAADVTPITGNGFPMPCIFQHLKGLDANIQTASFMNWPWIYWLSGRGSPGSVDLHLSCEGLLLSNPACDEYLAGEVASYMRDVVNNSPSSYTFLHMDQMDWAGHSFGWCDNLYLSQVDALDVLIGQLLDAADANDVLVLLSSDHGGHDTSHGSYIDEDLFIPMFVKGPGVKAGYEMQLDNRNMDMAPTAVWAMGHDPSPYWNGHVMYEVFED